MNLLPGKYFYEVKLVIGEDADGIVNTIIPKREFFILWGIVYDRKRKYSLPLW